MNLNKTVGFVIHKIPYQEYGEIITVITKNGLLKIIAKGIRKITSKNKIACEIGSYSQFEYIEGKMMHVLKTATVMISPLTLDYPSLLVIQCICELSYRFHFDDLNVITLALKMPNQHRLLYFLYVLTKQNGVMLEIHHCVRTLQEKQLIGLSIQDGGLVCLEALQPEDIRLTKNQWVILNVLDRVNETTLDKYCELVIDYQLCKIYFRLIAQQFNVYSKVEKYIEEGELYGKSI